MRDVVTNFYCDVRFAGRFKPARLRSRIAFWLFAAAHSMTRVMRQVGFTRFAVTALSHDDAQQDAENLTYANGSFDVAVVHAGLHHCYSPHRALLEMYRVSRKQAIAFESRDSFLMRTAVRLGLTLDCEIDAIVGDKGGVAETGVPNFVYRWTEREVEKVIASFDPIDPPQGYLPDSRCWQPGRRRRNAR